MKLAKARWCSLLISVAGAYTVIRVLTSDGCIVQQKDKYKIIIR